MFFRLRYAARRRAGGLRRAAPLVRWEDLPAPQLALAAPAPIGSDAIDERVLEEAEDVLRGRFRLFSHRGVDVGSPPDWRRNQLTGEQVPGDRHWSELGDFAFGDIKGVWELSRFSWAFPLMRAHRKTSDPRFADAFWSLFADWCEQNPPNRGPNWMCGQEATFRLLAVIFAAENLGARGREDAVARFIVATGRRIFANLDYALSQKNNHGVSECIGLVTAALAVRDYDESAGWLARGLRRLEEQLSELVYPDGGFSQHSLVYHRVLLHDLAWLKARLEAAGHSVPEYLDSAGRRATAFLRTLTDPATGQGPLYGPNDGANVLPLTSTEFLDLRPAVQLGAAVFSGELAFDSGPWDEAVEWLGPRRGKLERRGCSAPAVWHAPFAGCVQLRRGKGRLFLRCPEKFRHRPTQADLLHVDVWENGERVAMDGGSFSYNSRARFATLGDAAQHNVLVVDGREPLQKFSRFLYMPWPRGQVRQEGEADFSASHDGYGALGVRWVRRVSARAAAGFVVTDEVANAADRVLRWHWRLADRPWVLDAAAGTLSVRDELGGYRVAWHGPALDRVRFVRAADDSADGWWSPHYGDVAPAGALVIEVRARELVKFRTEFIPLD